jgi:hypothetical protein
MSNALSPELQALAREVTAAGGIDSPAGRPLAARLCFKFSIERLIRLDSEAAGNVMAAAAAILLMGELMNTSTDIGVLLADMTQNPDMDTVAVAPLLMRKVIESEGRVAPTFELIMGGKS